MIFVNRNVILPFDVESSRPLNVCQLGAVPCVADTDDSSV